MKILIDNSNLYAGGGLQVAASFLRDLKEKDSSDEYHVIQSLNSAIVLQNDCFPNNFLFYGLGCAEEKSKRKRIASVKKIENTIKPDGIFTLFGPSYHKSKFPKLVGFAIPYIIYQDSPFFKLISRKEKIYYKILAIIKTYSFKKFSDALVFETENARQVFTERENYSKSSFTVGNTLNEIFLTKSAWVNLEKLSDSSCKILFLTANYPHKNMQILPDLIKILKGKMNDFKFLITLNKEDLNFSDQINEHIEYLGKVDLSKIPSLYTQSDIVFIPTLLEVFSATYLEAMLMKKPVVASDLGFSRDICGDSAYFCNPTNAQSYADALIALNNDKDLKEDLVRRGLENLKRFGSSMDRTNRYLEIIKELIGNYDNSK